MAVVVVLSLYKITCRLIDRRELRQACSVALTHQEKDVRDNAADLAKALLDAETKRSRWNVLPGRGRAPD